VGGAPGESYWSTSSSMAAIRSPPMRSSNQYSRAKSLNVLRFTR
jgi:hypothetical protein